MDAAGAGDATPLGFSELGRYGNEIVFHHRARGLDVTDGFHFKHDGRKSECRRAVESGVEKCLADVLIKAQAIDKSRLEFPQRPAVIVRRKTTVGLSYQTFPAG